MSTLIPISYSIVSWRLISSRIKSWSESVRRIGRLCKALRAWFLLHTFLVICLTSVHSITYIYWCTIVSRDNYIVLFFWFFPVPLFVIFHTVHLLCFDRELTRFSYFSIVSCVSLKCVGLLKEFYHILAHCGHICCINVSMFTFFNQCIHVVTDTVKYNLVNFFNIFTRCLIMWKSNNFSIVKRT